VVREVNLPTISVVLPTYRRPEMLRQCLEALCKQTDMPIEIYVGRRANDAESGKVLAEYSRRSQGIVREAVVPNDANLVVSLNAALTETTGDLVALTDDDAEAPPEWLAKLRQSFCSEDIGGVGGLDIQPPNPGAAAVVGKVQWFGRVIGNHHLGFGEARDVDLLKGVNCCFRGSLLREIGFDRRLRGAGNVTHWEMHLCFAIRRMGLRLVYDPSIWLDHHVAPRHDGDVNDRGVFSRLPFEDSVHNSFLAVMEYLPTSRRFVFRFWQALVGTRAEPGLIQVLRLAVLGTNPAAIWERFCGTRRGISMALQSRKTRG